MFRPPGNRARTSASGFTLIEILVALVLISIVLGVALLRFNIHDFDEHLKEESRRLAHLIELADQQAIYQTQEVGLLFERDQYRFLVFSDDKWTPIDDDLFRARPLPDDIEIILNIEGAEIRVTQSAQQAETPQIVFYSSGEWTPFEITLQATDNTISANRFVLNNLETGKLKLEQLNASF